ncbi:glycosyltransferase family 4 protein [Nonlabens marinus]|uniref:Glycosyl transferase, group 1 n=1 Tax=Nonlabens marinus S1-08 TaxID=1454201 RepID=W8VVU1_9FLAO|nr:glycosyltransferase family 4 protein [Nonlabens marinus]BAO55748.1 glycosyl transferase, group 1 [Nonlabens marinus S1-08]
MYKRPKHIAIVCNYEVRPDRVGGMDRFFVAYDAFAKANSFQVTWYFSRFEPYSFYSNLTIKNADGENVESFFLKQLAVTADEYDILITHFTSLCNSFYKQARKIQDFEKVIVVDHNPRPLNGFTFKKRLKNRVKGLLYHKYVDQFIGVSNYTSHHIIKDLGLHVAGKTTTIHNGIDTSQVCTSQRNRARTYTQTDKLKLIIVSHLRESKGIQDVIAAISKLEPAELQKVETHIYGSGPMEKELKDQVALNDLSNCIFFKGSSAQIPELLADFDYLLQPTYMECFSLSILESLAANVPVITTTVGGNPEIIIEGENGFLFEAKNTTRLIQILKDLLNNEKGIYTSTSDTIRNGYTLEKMVIDHLKPIN